MNYYLATQFTIPTGQKKLDIASTCHKLSILKEVNYMIAGRRSKEKDSAEGITRRLAHPRHQ